MHHLIQQKLQSREAPIQVAVVGCGWYGSGVVKELQRTKGMVPRVIVDRHGDRHIQTLLETGVQRHEIAEVQSAEELRNLLQNKSHKHIVSQNTAVLAGMTGIDVIFEGTGDLLGATETALHAIKNQVHFVTVSAEMDATIGLILSQKAREQGIVYSVADGDQPGVLARMLHEIQFWGFEPKVVGNSKGFLDFYQTPEGVVPFIREGQSPIMQSAAADGSKQALEMVVIANAFGLRNAKRGMHGPHTNKGDIVSCFDSLLDFSEGGYVDYVMGLKDVDEGGGVFIVAERKEQWVQKDLDYLKKGEGPLYLFFRDHHLCYLESVYTLAEAVLLKSAHLVPQGRFCDAITLSKADMLQGARLEGMGVDVYGMTERADIVADEKLLPLGLAAFATLKQNISQDTPITYDMVDLDDNVVTALRKEQELIPLVSQIPLKAPSQ